QPGGGVRVGGVGDPVRGLCGVAAGMAGERGGGRAVGVLERAVARGAGGVGIADGPGAAGGAELSRRNACYEPTNGIKQRTQKAGPARECHFIYDVARGLSSSVTTLFRSGSD